MKHIANFVSVVLHPLIMPTLGLFLIFKSATFLSYIPFNLQKILIYIIAIVTLFIPVFMLPFLYMRKFVKTFELDDRSERVLPFFLTTVLFLVGYIYMRQINAPEAIQLYILAVTIVSLAASIITMFWKISVHMAGIGGVLGLIFVFSMKYMAQMDDLILVFILLSGIVASSRLYLNSHNIPQILSGFILGLATVPITFLLLA